MGKRGITPFEPTNAQRDAVMVAASGGVQHTMICRLIINPTTDKAIGLSILRKAFHVELRGGREMANAKVIAALFRMATNEEKPDHTAAIFWLKCQAGWREPATQVEMKFDAADMTRFTQEELETIAAGHATDELLARISASAKTPSARTA